MHIYVFILKSFQNISKLYNSEKHLHIYLYFTKILLMFVYVYAPSFLSMCHCYDTESDGEAPVMLERW